MRRPDSHTPTLLRLGAGLVVAGLLAPIPALLADRQTGPGARFEVQFAASARSETVTGRVYLAISRANDRQTPIQQASPTGAPLFSVAVENLAPGATVGIGPEAFGHPVQSLRD